MRRACYATVTAAVLGLGCATTLEVRNATPDLSQLLPGKQKVLAGCAAEQLAGRYQATLIPILQDDPAESILSGIGPAFGGGTTLVQEIRFKQVDPGNVRVEFRTRGVGWEGDRSMWEAAVYCSHLPGHPAAP